MNLLTLSPRLLIVTLLLGICLVGPLPAYAADTPSKSDDLADVRAEVDNAIRKLSMGITTAFDDLVKSRWANRTQADSIALSLQQALPRARTTFARNIGPPLLREYEFLGTVRPGGHLISFSYLLRHEWNSLPVDITLFQLDGKWRLIGVNWAGQAVPASRHFLRFTHPSDAHLDAAPKADLLQPASMADLKHACEAVLTRIAAGETTGLFTQLVRDHFASLANAAEMIDATQSAFQRSQPDSLAQKGRPLPGKPEFLGIIWMGTNSATLHFSQAYERGADSWAFTLYRPGRAWRLNGITANKVPLDEQFLLLRQRPANAPLPEDERPFAAVVERMVAGIAGSSPTAVDELLRKHRLKNDSPDELSRHIGVWTANLPLLDKSYGSSQPPRSLFLGSCTKGVGERIYVHLNLRERNVFPVATTAMLRDGRRQSITTDMGEEALDIMQAFYQFERRQPAPGQPAPPAKSPLPDLAALEQSCDRFMTRVSNGKLIGSLEELALRHKPVDEDFLIHGRPEESKAQFTLEGSVQTHGKPVPGRFEYLGAGRCDSFLARLVYQLVHERGVTRWVFSFYRVKNEWRLLNVGYPGRHPWEADHLAVTEPASPGATAK